MTFLVSGDDRPSRVVYPLRIHHRGKGVAEVAFAQASADLREEGLPEITADGEGGHHVHADATKVTGLDATVGIDFRHARAAERIGAIVGERGLELDLEAPFEASVAALPRLPLYVAVSEGCNLSCWYCTEHGENRAFGPRVLPTPRLIELLQIAYEAGFRVFRFTGGEPTLRKDLPEIMRSTQALGDDVRIAITTNGKRLGRMLDAVAELRDPKVFLSVDGLAGPSGAPPGADRDFRVSKWITPQLVELIDQLQPLASVRLNYVLTRTSREQLWELIEFASERGLDVKIFELLLRDFIGTGGLSRQEAFAEQYIPIRSLIPELVSRFGSRQRFPGLGGRGIPMTFVSNGNNRIIFFDSLAGSHYSARACGKCRHRPCQEGLYAPVLNASGTLHPAGCMNPRLYSPLLDAERDKAIAEFGRMRNEILRSRLEPEIPSTLQQIAEEA